jgi:hypothetical protein
MSAWLGGLPTPKPTTKADLKQKQTPRRPSLADQPKDYRAAKKAINEQWELQPNKQPDPEAIRLNDRIDGMASERDRTVINKLDEQQTRDGLSLCAVRLSEVTTEIAAQQQALAWMTVRGDRSERKLGPIRKKLRDGLGRQKRFVSLRELYGQRLQTLLSSPRIEDAGAPHGKITPSASKGRERAMVVAKLIKELNALRPQMQVPEDDYSELSRQNARYLVFKICKEHSAAAHWVKLLLERRSVNSIAYELAAVHFGVRAATIQTAWKRYKPNKLKRYKHNDSRTTGKH